MVSGEVKTNPSLASRCPGCGSTSFRADPRGVPVCEYCDSAYISRSGTCHRCGAGYETASSSCPSCGAELARQCPSCGVLNPLAAGQCVVCGQTLDAVDAMFARLTRSTPDQLRRVREAGANIKAQEEVASEVRLAKLWAEDERRREELASARAERLRQERLGLALVIGVGLVVVVIAVVVATVVSGDAPFPLF